MRKEIILPGSKWQHFKGSIMTVITIAKDSETLEDTVVYEHDHTLWVRTISSFLSPEDISKRKDNKTGQIYRFEKIS